MDEALHFSTKKRLLTSGGPLLWWHLSVICSTSNASYDRLVFFLCSPPPTFNESPSLAFCRLHPAALRKQLIGCLLGSETPITSALSRAGGSLEAGALGPWLGFWLWSPKKQPSCWGKPAAANTSASLALDAKKATPVKRSRYNPAVSWGFSRAQISCITFGKKLILKAAEKSWWLRL